jgi:hypothetical protein
MAIWLRAKREYRKGWEIEPSRRHRRGYDEIVANAVAISAGEITCLSCGYCLAGLVECRCPECGRAFDPGDPRTFKMGRWSPRVVALAQGVCDAWRGVVRFIRIAAPRVAKVFRPCIPAALVWIAFISLDALIGVAVAALVLLYLLIRKRWKPLIIALVASPFTGILIVQGVSYVQGGYSPVRQYLRTPAASIATDSRCNGRESWVDCGMRPRDAWSIFSQTLAPPIGRAMFHVIGPPPDAYDGPYPAEAQAIAAVRGGSRLRFDPRRGIVGLPGVDLDEISGRHFDYLHDGSLAEPILATIVGGRCLILRTPEYFQVGDLPARVSLIDLQTGNQFALYLDPQPLPAPPALNVAPTSKPPQ